jgi:hypothetical protein
VTSAAACPLRTARRPSTGLRDLSRWRPLAVAGYTVAHGQVGEIDPLADPAPSRPARHPLPRARAGASAPGGPVSAILTASSTTR